MTTYDEFFADHYDEVVRTLALAVGDRGRAEDAAQEAFARAFRKWPTVSQMDRPVGWVVIVGMNQMKRWITRVDRRDQDHRPALEAVARTGLDPDHGDPAGPIADATALRAALDRLGPRQRATVVLRYLCDLPTDDVAKALGCSPGTVKSALSAALANLRVEFDESQLDPTARSTNPTPEEEVRHATR
jgi:RNA polymerase sigma factor (sigma-70 family)